ncbi:MAG: hypothetical protein SNF33_00150 (plasmid) [Candidatus Algichlamydia australiensis]|nr:hypothetical protein [Chlamydiales bacterium]
MRKVGVSKEFDLCSYLPEGGRRTHHFTYEKLKIKNPKDLICLLEKHILENSAPQQYPSKPRSKKGSSGSLQLNLKKNQAQELLQLAKESGNAELIELLKPAYPLKEIQKELILSIKEKRADRSLWKAYEEAIKELENEK